MNKHVFITGADGYIGKAVITELLASNWSIHALVRHPGNAPPGCIEHVGDIRHEPDALANAMRGCSILIHLAAAKSDEPWSEDVNVRGTANVWEAAEIAGITHAIYMSTQSARLHTPGTYGRTKREGEEIVRSKGIPSTILRPSLVYGDDDSGVFGTLKRASALPIIPIFGPGTAIFRPIHVEDLAKIIAVCIVKNTKNATIDIGGPDALTFDALIGEILQRTNMRRIVLHVPRYVGYAIAMLPRSPISMSNVRGGIERIHMDMQPQRQLWGIEPRAFRMDTRFERTLLQYVFRIIIPQWNPPADVIDRMTAAMRIHNIPAMQLTPLFLLGPIDAASRIFWPNGSLQRAIRLAAAIAETQPEGAEQLLPKNISISRIIVSTILILIQASITIIIGCMLTIIAFPYVRRHAA